MHNNMQHKGIIDLVSGSHVSVRVNRQTACSSCQMLERCHTSDGGDRFIEVPIFDDDDYKVGDSVLVCADSKVGRLAVFLGFCLPLMLLVSMTVLVRVMTCDDTTAALCGLAALIPYYIVLRFFRLKIQRKVTFRLKKVDGAENNINNKRIQESL